MDMYTVQVRGGDVVRAVVGHKVRVPFCSRCPLIATHSSSFHPHGCTHAQVAAVGLMDDRLAAVDSPLPSTIAALKPLRPHVHRFDVLGPLRRHRRRRVLPSRHCPHPKTSPPPLAPLSTAQRRQRLSTNLEVPSLACIGTIGVGLEHGHVPSMVPLSSSLSPFTLHRYTVAYAALARPISSHQRSQGHIARNRISFNTVATLNRQDQRVVRISESAWLVAVARQLCGGVIDIIVTLDPNAPPNISVPVTKKHPELKEVVATKIFC
ncbi:hypothetical protein B0H14DRAFT_3754597 [Mycena olivaceomarginata]|nr:hypothetical protein B0H14DRAFT_3754597 [Mycena olivaceomarginata]